MQTPKTGYRLLIAGGGTGGHLFPGIAVAEDFLSRNPENRVLFVNTGRPIDKKALDARGLERAEIPAAALKGKGLVEKCKALWQIPRSLVAAFRLLFRFRPHGVLGVGGYAAAPATLAAKLLGIPVFLHEQNMLAGLTNRILSTWADEVHVSFADTQIRVPEERLRITGNPVRKNMFNCRTKERGPKDPLHLLILGGSQGARGINLAMAEALPLLDHRMIRITHQTGEADHATVCKAYGDAGVRAEIAPFFMDMKDRYAAADLAVCRSGATTVAELAAAGVGAVLIPFPAAADNHQYHNATALSGIGAGIIIEQKDLDPAALAKTLNGLAMDPDTTEIMAKKARELARPDAAKDLTDAIYNRITDKNIKQDH